MVRSAGMHGKFFCGCVPILICYFEIMTKAPACRVLVLDDDLMILSALDRILRNEFELVLVSGIDEARDAVRSQDFELALIDLHLKSGTSLDFFRELQISSPLTVRVLISGAINLNSLLDSLSSTLVHKVLQKPWEPSSLIVQINEARQIHQLLKENSRLELLSTTDAMTGLYNYRFLQEVLPKELDRASRTARPFSMLMLDVDGFKAWNDSKGHLAGDQVIRQIAKCIKESLRTFDVVCRYGGDEFCVLLQETDLATAFEIGERIRKRVQRDSPLTISLGITSFPKTSPDFKRVLADADTALYTAKNAGRNCCVIAGSQGPS